MVKVGLNTVTLKACNHCTAFKLAQKQEHKGVCVVSKLILVITSLCPPHVTPSIRQVSSCLLR